MREKSSKEPKNIANNTEYDNIETFEYFPGFELEQSGNKQKQQGSLPPTHTYTQDILNSHLYNKYANQALLNGKNTQKMSKKQEAKLIKKRQKKLKKDLVRNPFTKNHIIQKSVESKTNNLAVKDNYINMIERQRTKSRYYTQAQKAKTLEDVEKAEELYKKEDKQQEYLSRELKFNLLEEDLKRALEGPAGWAKNIKGCFSSAMICLTVFGGGIIALILGIYL